MIEHGFAWCILLVYLCITDKNKMLKSAMLSLGSGYSSFSLFLGVNYSILTYQLINCIWSQSLYHQSIKNIFKATEKSPKGSCIIYIDVQGEGGSQKSMFFDKEGGGLRKYLCRFLQYPQIIMATNFGNNFTEKNYGGGRGTVPWSPQ